MSDDKEIIDYSNTLTMDDSKTNTDLTSKTTSFK